MCRGSKVVVKVKRVVRLTPIHIHPAIVGPILGNQRREHKKKASNDIIHHGRRALVGAGGWVRAVIGSGIASQPHQKVVDGQAGDKQSDDTTGDQTTRIVRRTDGAKIPRNLTETLQAVHDNRKEPESAHEAEERHCQPSSEGNAL